MKMQVLLFVVCLTPHISCLRWVKFFWSHQRALWRRVLAERWRRRRPDVQLHLPLPPDRQGVIAAPAPLTCLIYPDFPIFIPRWSQRHDNLSYLVWNTTTFQALAWKGSQPAQPEMEDLSEEWRRGGSRGDGAGSLRWVHMVGGYRQR